MPAPTLPDNTLRAKFYYQTPNRTCSFDLYYEADDPATMEPQEQIEAVADALYATFSPLLIACMSDAFTFKGVMCYWHGAGDSLWEGAKMLDTQGTYTAIEEGGMQALPDECAVIIRKLTGKEGPEDRGRIFLSTIAEGQQASGVLAAGEFTVYQNLAAKIPQDIAVAATVGPPTTVSVLLHARHWNRKENLLRPIVAARVVRTIASRKDRRKPLIALPAV